MLQNNIITPALDVKPNIITLALDVKPNHSISLSLSYGISVQSLYCLVEGNILLFGIHTIRSNVKCTTIHEYDKLVLTLFFVFD